MAADLTTRFDDRLRAAWREVPVPAPSTITNHQCAECDEVAEYFGGRRWQQVTEVSELRYHSVALALFSDVAFHYYLPAFMMAALQGDPADAIPVEILSTFSYEFGPAARGRLRLFDIHQRVLIAEFVERVGEQDQNMIALASLLRHSE